MIENTSGASACNISASGERYRKQRLIVEYVQNHPGLTAKEIARGLGWQHEEYCDCPKRIHDLVHANPEPRLIEGRVRECRYTKKQARTYYIPGSVGARVIKQVATVSSQQLRDDGAGRLERTPSEVASRNVAEMMSWLDDDGEAGA